MVELVLVRHAQADDDAPSGRDDDRALSERGIKRFTESVAGLMRLGLELDLVLTSPWRRALETAELLQPLVRDDRPFEACEALIEPPGERLLEALDEALSKLQPVPDERTESRPQRIALVGHEPWMALLCAWLVTGDKGRHGNFSFKKGAVAWLEGRPRPAAMSLRAFLPPAVTRRLAPYPG